MPTLASKKGKSIKLCFYTALIQHALHAYFWVPCFCTQQLSSFKQGHPKMGSKSAYWTQFRPKPYACMQRAPGTEPDNRPCLTSISCPI